ncbi:transient receptor potential cation channel subfamily M member 5-like [Littorina saxatilis]|uniref:transient receptor potential cation channel subfamily M member 5-like n=1 Tax=Littorina saxatilis TaxID=31220 RepID=UPI0038B694E5
MRNWLHSAKNYWRQNWNKVDVVSIIVFVLGITLVFAPSKPANIVGRVVLAANFSVFSLRFLQRLMVFTELGLLLVMAEKMMMDSVRFMMILLTVMMSYAVTSESVLYPDMKFSWSALYHLPNKAFWQTFGELGLEEIQGDECAKDGLCPSPYGQYLVPVMVALYVITSHVLLLNLLIAQFK